MPCNTFILLFCDDIELSVCDHGGTGSISGLPHEGGVVGAFLALLL